MIGQRLGPYEIVDQIGEGGMATVYLARQTRVGRNVAIKVIGGNIGQTPDSVRRFQREARLISRLEHVNILPVYDFDGSHDPLYIVMRYLDGGTLRQVLDQGLLPIAEVAYLMRQICSAVDYANRQGIIHRDLKPSNVLVDREGNAFVADFGLARMTNPTQEDKQNITEAGQAIGTPSYMSPEQALHDDKLDHRTDIYALGVMLFEMLTGQLPYSDPSSMRVISMHLIDPIPSPLAIQPDLPSAMDEVIQRAMAKDADDRYASALTLSDAVTDAVDVTANRPPTMLREAAKTATLRRVGVDQTETNPSEQNKTVIAVNVGAADYALLVEEIVGAEAAARTLENLWSELVILVSESGGTILNRSETEMLVVWGADIVHESDAEEAIHTALKMQTTLQDIGAEHLADDEEPLPLNIGIHSGMVLLKPTGSDDSVSASGSTISIANRLMQNAFGTILISHATFRQVAGVFDINEDVPLRIRGRQEPLDTYRVIGVKPRAFRIQMRGIEGLETQMIGRDAELRHLQQALLDAIEEYETQIVTIIGDPGTGKSRLLYEFNKWAEIRPERFRVFDGLATTNMRERPYALIRDIVSARFEILDSDSLPTIQEKLEAGVAELLGDANLEMAHFIGYLCGFDLSESPYIKGILHDPQQVNQLGRQNFIRLITTIAESRQPVVMRLEDIHHADDASLDLLTDLFIRNHKLPLMVICVARPQLFERREGWGSGHDIYTLIELNALSKGDSRNLVAELLQNIEDVPKTLRDLLVDRAEGIPFYMEELVKMLLDDRVILRESDDVWAVEESRLDTQHIPTSLSGLLEARVDTLLNLEKLTLQRASVVGRIFYRSALEAIDEADEMTIHNLGEVLETLVQREFIYRRPTSAIEDDTEYIFASNMLRDAIENALLERQIHTYNLSAAQWLDAIAGERHDEILSQLARYYARAGETLKAAEHWHDAGELALRLGDRKQALILFKQAHEHLPYHVNLLRQMAEVLFLQEGYDAAEPYLAAAEKYAQTDKEKLQVILAQSAILPETDQSLPALEAAIPLARQVNDPRLLARTLVFTAKLYSYRHRMELVPGYLNEALELARKNHATDLEIATLVAIFIFYFTQEDYETALEYGEQALEIARKIGDRASVSMSLNNIAVTLGRIDREKNLDQQYALVEEALETERELGGLSQIAAMLTNLSFLDIEKKNYQRARVRLRESMHIATSAGIPRYVFWTIRYYAEMLLSQGQLERGLALYGMLRQQTLWTASVETQLQKTLDRYSIQPEDAEAGMAGGTNLDFDETAEEIRADLEGDGN